MHSKNIAKNRPQRYQITKISNPLHEIKWWQQILGSIHTVCNFVHAQI